MSRPARFGIAALLLLAAAGLTVAVPDVAEVPLAAPLDLLPAGLPGWSPAGQVPVGVLPPDPRAGREVVRTYAGAGTTMWLAVGYYPAQKEGRRPAARDLLFAAHGWTDLTESRISLPVAAAGGGGLPANALIMRRGEERLAILYWYLVQGRPLASDHWYRARVAWNRLAHGRADGALIRLASPLPPGTPPETVMVSQTRFLEAFYPELLRTLPR